MKKPRHLIRLTDEQVLLLASVDEDETQEAVSLARLRLEYEAKGLHWWSADVRIEAETAGRLQLARKDLQACDLCGKRAGYAKYARATRNHRRGDNNYGRPLSMLGVDLAVRAVTVRGRASLGCCNDCWGEVKDSVSQALVGVRAEVPEGISGEPVRWRWHAIRRCEKCGWEGGEHLVRRLPCLMGGGTYPGKCPACGASSRPLCASVLETLPGFVLVPA